MDNREVGVLLSALVLFSQKPVAQKPGGKPPVESKSAAQKAPIQKAGGVLPKQLSASLTLKGGTYRITEPLVITGSNIVFDGGGATLTGTGEAGIQIGKATNVTIRNLKISGFRWGVYVEGATGLKLIDVDASKNANHFDKGEIAGLHVSKLEEPNDGGGIFLRNVAGGLLQRVQGHSEWSGVTLSGCQKMVLDHCDFSKNDNSGVYLWNSSDNEVRDCRIAWVGSGISKDGVFGASGSTDEGGIVIEHNSGRNRILRNNLVHCRRFGIQLKGSEGTVVPAAEAAKRGWPAQGEHPVVFAADPCDGNVFNGNDASYAGYCAFGGTGGTGNSFQANVAAFSQTGFGVIRGQKIEIKENLIVGNTCGVSIDDSWAASVEGNTFVRSFGSPVAVRAKGPKGDVVAEGSAVNRTGNLSAFDNLFVGYPRPFTLDNASPATLQSNTFVNVDAGAADDLVSANGPAPLVLNSNFKAYVSPDMVASVGEGALMPSPLDTLGGVLLIRPAAGAKEAIVMGSLTGKFDGEEFEVARLSGTGSVRFPARFVPFVRVKGAAPTPGSFLGLVGEQSLTKGGEAAATSDQKAAAFAVDGDWDTPGQVWEASYEENQSIRIDLPRTKMVDTIAIAADVRDPASFWKQFHIVVSATGDFRGEEATVVTEKEWDHRPGPVRVYRFPAVRASAIRIVGDMAQKDVRLQELGIYGNGQ